MRVFVLLIALVTILAVPSRADDIAAAQNVIRSQEQALAIFCAVAKRHKR